MQAAFELARAVLADNLRTASPERQARMIEAHAALVRLGAEAPIFNYEPPMLAMEMGALLASASGR